jgi:hypothetical protein
MWISSVQAACAIDLNFCAEIMGQMFQNIADLSMDSCTREAAEAAAKGIRSLGTLAALIPVLSLGRMEGLAIKAAAEGGEIVQASGTAKQIWQESYRAIRSADQIIFHTTGVPATLGDAIAAGGGQFSRAEMAVIQSRADLAAKTVFVP